MKKYEIMGRFNDKLARKTEELQNRQRLNAFISNVLRYL